MATRRVDKEEYVAATAVAREMRGVVAEQLAELVREGDRMGNGTEVSGRIERVNFCLRRVAEAKGRQSRNRVMGMPVSSAVRDEAEFRELLRDAVMQLGVSCGSWVAAMDYEHARVEKGASEESPDAD